MAAYGEVEDVKQFTCPICLDIYEEPVVIPCGNNHVCCHACLEPVVEGEMPRCTLCRQEIDRNRITPATDVRSKMSHRTVCFACKAKIQLRHMRNHLSTCGKIDRTIHHFKPVVETANIPQEQPNRCTFQCPFCGLRNLDTIDLVKHCNDQHDYNTASVVCPICASMPWGSKTQKSSNFIQHLNMRHKFEYDTYVDFGQDDDAMLQAALQASLEGK